MHQIPFIDLESQRRRIAPQVESAVVDVLRSGQYIMGPAIRTLENDLSQFTNVPHVLSCANGTDALLMALLALDVKAGDVVFVPSFTFAATAEMVALIGAVPYFVDVLEHTFNMDPENLHRAILDAKSRNMPMAGAIVVDLFGQPADYDALQSVLDPEGLWMMVDAAQSLGATYKGKSVASYGVIATTSFFPAKPLGCYGDGGAVFTHDTDLAAKMASIRVHGQDGEDKYKNTRVGINGRLDTIQAAVLIEKLKIFPDEIRVRNQAATYYSQRLQSVGACPGIMLGATSVWAQYTLRLENRDQMQKKLGDQGIPSVVYYPRPLNTQDAYKHFPCTPGGMNVSERLSKTVLSLPMHGYLTPGVQDRIIGAVLG